MFKSSKQIYLRNFAVNGFIAVQRDASHPGDSSEYAEKKIQRLRSSLINTCKLFVLPGGND